MQAEKTTLADALKEAETEVKKYQVDLKFVLINNILYRSHLLFHLFLANDSTKGQRPKRTSRRMQTTVQTLRATAPGKLRIASQNWKFRSEKQGVISTSG